MTRKALFVLSFFGFLFEIGCGGSISFTSSESPTVTSVSVSCTPTSILTGQTSQCSATVSGTGNYSSGVTWSATDGTVTAGGVFTSSGAGTATITATSTQDSTKSGSAPVGVTGPSTITSVSVLCSPATILTTQTSTCTATLQGTGAFSSAVTWAATDGTINSSGVFTPTAAGSATITATSTQDSTKSGSAPVTVVAVTGGSCNITATGTIQADGSLGGDPFLGDVYQIQGTITADYVDDDEAGNSTVTFTAPDGHTVTVGMFLLNAHANGTNAFAVRVAAGYVARGSWVPGTWTWAMNYSDRTSNTCTATGSFTVQNAFAPSQGFLRQVGSTPNLETDGDGKLFIGAGFGWYFPYYNGTADVYGVAEIPCSATVNVSGTSVTYLSGNCSSTTGSGFSTQPLTNAYPAISICPTFGTCTHYYDTTINSSTSMTLPSSGGTLNAVQAYVWYTRSSGRALGYQATIPQAAQWYAYAGNNFFRFHDGNGATVEDSSGWLSTGYNDYNWNNTTGTTWGIPAVDLWFAAAHAYGGHLTWGGPNQDEMEFLCPSFVCTSTEKQNLQNWYGMVSARWGAFYDAVEVMNEGISVPQTFVDDVGQVLEAGVSGIAGGNPADPYGHFFTTSYFPNNPVYGNAQIYGPFSSPYVSDPYLNMVDIPHTDGPVHTTIYTWMTNWNADVNGCPASSSYGGSTLPRFNGEQGDQVGIPPSSQSVAAPNDSVNGQRIVEEQNYFNQCAGANSQPTAVQMEFNPSTPVVSTSWYDVTSGNYLIRQFMVGLDTAAAPITVTLGGGCASSACSYAALGSSNHIRLVLNSATGNSTTGVPNTVTNPSVTLMVPAASMNVNWVNPATGAVLASTTTTSGTQTLIYTGTFQYDLWLQLDF
jgi:hypothetical protein